MRIGGSSFGTAGRKLYVFSMDGNGAAREGGSAWLWLRGIASPRLTVGVLLWMCVLTVWGTIAQADPAVGLYGATRRFFHSWFFRAPGGLPLPGGAATAALALLHLAASMATRLGPFRRRPGLWITHGGLAILIGGGLAAGRLSRDATLALAEGETASAAVSETEWELALVRRRADGGRDVEAWPLRSIRPGFRWTVNGMAEPLVVEAVFRSVEPPGGVSEVRPADLRPTARPADPRRALPAMVVRVGRETGVLVGEGQGLELPTTDARRPALLLRRERRPLPFTIRLIDFEKKLHPNTQMPRSFVSRVEVTEGGSRREVTISMNRPLRRGQWAVFQSSYMEPAGGPEISVLAVSENHVRLLPYLATVVMLAGMIVHYARPREDDP